MKYIVLLVLINGIILSNCSQKSNAATNTALEKTEAFDESNDKKEILELIRQLYKWEANNQITIGQLAITDEIEEKVIGFDTIKSLEFIDMFRKTKLLSEEFLSNYQKIVKTLDKKFKLKEMEWFAGDMPPYGNGSNPWCNCQDEPYAEHWNKIEITFIEINQFDASLTWTWGQSDWSKGFNYKVRVTKENEKWKISYLQGFDFDKFTRNN
ncbi:hypothetical protein DF185_01355 [Marinifilum breve]|uniref:DUF3828 domain-containing protein n=1 Tax=Marinifilum breve TaxID=2184082 RepID=A0A2V4A4E7_9BACT|nr:hypothetical protein [Marinifilum breve]PXY02767.1 hypothetical protein DF185_01355 [Marinifilum breve]